MSKVLLVEDDTMFVKMYQKKFTREGIELITALDGVEGLEQMKKIKPDLVILDLMMPKMSGTEVLRAIRKDPKLKNIPIIVMTNLNSSSEELNEAMSLGIKETILKTEVTPAEIIEVTRKYLKD